MVEWLQDEDPEFKLQYFKKRIQQAPMAHACNPSYSGGRD
jgi:hypothetical protein